MTERSLKTLEALRLDASVPESMAKPILVDTICDLATRLNEAFHVLAAAKAAMIDAGLTSSALAVQCAGDPVAVFLSENADLMNAAADFEFIDAEMSEAVKKANRILSGEEPYTSPYDDEEDPNG